MIYVLDASALIAYVRGETGSDVVRQGLRDAANTCYAHALNLCEVYYDHARVAGETTAATEIRELQAAGLIFREDLDVAFWQEAGRYKAAHRRVSLADCFGITLARRVDGELVTGDHREFDPLVPLGLCRVRFFR
jgi:predicted nucleic acid-binding protein